MQVEHYALLRQVASLCDGGTALEFGVATGESTRIIAEQMPVIGFDSFEGLPEDWRPEFPSGSFAHKPPKIDNCQLIIGMFEDTLPTFIVPDDISLVHLDADLYSSTKVILDYIGPHLSSGTYLVFDEFYGYDDGPGASWRDHECKAWMEFVDSTGIKWTVIGTHLEAWAIQIA